MNNTCTKKLLAGTLGLLMVATPSLASKTNDTELVENSNAFFQIADRCIRADFNDNQLGQIQRSFFDAYDQMVARTDFLRDEDLGAFEAWLFDFYPRVKEKSEACVAVMDSYYE
jgi:hypothetical protein